MIGTVQRGGRKEVTTLSFTIELPVCRSADGSTLIAPPREQILFGPAVHGPSGWFLAVTVATEIATVDPDLSRLAGLMTLAVRYEDRKTAFRLGPIHGLGTISHGGEMLSPAFFPEPSTELLVELPVLLRDQPLPPSVGERVGTLKLTVQFAGELFPLMGTS